MFSLVWYGVCAGEEDGRDWTRRAIQIEVRVRKVGGGAATEGHSRSTLSQISTENESRTVAA